jgi:hypothetical protein
MRTNMLSATTAVAVLLAGPLGAHAAGSTMYGPSHLLQQMDADMNGTVSKGEFLRFMSRAFQHLDTNHNGKLEPAELRPLGNARWAPGGVGAETRFGRRR